MLRHRPRRARVSDDRSGVVEQQTYQLEGLFRIVIAQAVLLSMACRTDV